MDKNITIDLPKEMKDKIYSISVCNDYLKIDFDGNNTETIQSKLNTNSSTLVCHIQTSKYNQSLISKYHIIK